MLWILQWYKTKKKTTLKIIRITNGSSFILVLYFVQIDTRDSKDVRLYCILEEIVEKKKEKKTKWILIICKEIRFKSARFTTVFGLSYVLVCK